MQDKKGNFNVLTVAAVSAGSFFLVLTVLALMFALMGNQASIKPVYGVPNTAVTGETITIINGTAVPVAKTLVNGSTWKLYNGSNVLGNGNFSFNNASGTVTFLATNTIPQYNGTLVSVNYTYDNSATLLSGDTNTSAVVNDGLISSRTFSSLGTIFVYVIFLVAVLGLLALIGYGVYRATR